MTTPLDFVHHTTDPELADALARAGLPIKDTYSDDELVMLLLLELHNADSGPGRMTSRDGFVLPHRCIGTIVGLSWWTVRGIERTALNRMRRQLHGESVR